MKALGIWCILSVGVLSMLLYLKEQARQKNLRHQLLTFLLLMQGEIRYRQTPLPSLFRRFAQEPGSAGSFFAAVGKSLEADPDRPLSRHWLGALDCLPREQQEWMERLGRSLDGDEQSIQKALDLAIRELEEQKRQREQEQRGKARLWCGLCFSAACLLILLLI